MRRRVPIASRGFSVLIAMGMVAAFTLAALLSLTYVTESNEVQGQSRRSKEAFFAAEAGMAEAKERLRILAGNSGTYKSVLQQAPPLGVAPPYSTFNPDHPQPVDPFNNNQWYELNPNPLTGGWTPYSLTGLAAPQAALDDTVTTPNSETFGPAADGQYVGYPTQSNVSYRVFLRDNFDEAPPAIQDQTLDSDGMIWIVSIGQVTGTGGRPVQAVITALVRATTGGTGAPSGTSQRMSNITSGESGTPSLTSSINLN